MEIKGDDFLKRIQVQQERDELEQKLSELEEVDKTLKQTSPTQQKIDEFPPVQDDNELDNIMLQTANSNEDNKKMYLGLGAALIILFLSIIIIYRLFNDSPKEDPFTADKTQSLEEVKAKEESNINQSFQKIMNDKRKEESQENIISEEKMNEIKPIVQKEEAISDDELDETIKKIEQQRQEVKEEVKKPVFKKPQIKEEKVQNTKSVKDLINNTSTSSKPKGYFVQIGAFSKKPSNSYINKIRNAGYKYKIHKVEVKGKLYNKVLIGPYSSKAVAKQNIESIKKSLGLSGAYVLKF